MMRLFNSKSADVFFAVLLGFFAWNRYTEGHTAVAIMLVVISVLNIVSFFTKISIERKVNRNQ